MAKNITLLLRRSKGSRNMSISAGLPVHLINWVTSGLMKQTWSEQSWNWLLAKYAKANPVTWTLSQLGGSSMRQMTATVDCPCNSRRLGLSCTYQGCSEIPEAALDLTTPTSLQAAPYWPEKGWGWWLLKILSSSQCLLILGNKPMLLNPLWYTLEIPVIILFYAFGLPHLSELWLP